MISWLTNADLLPPLLADNIDKLNRGELPPHWSWVDCSPFANVATNSESTLFYKAFLPRNLWETPKAWLRGSRAQRAITQATFLTEQGFNTPAVVCWGKLKKGREFMMTKAVNGIGTGSCLASYFRGRHDQTSLKWKRQLIKHIGRLVAQLHQAGIVHGDLRPNNILLELGKQPFTFHLIDNERNYHYKTVPHKLIIKNLVQIGMLADIDISNTDRMRFYCSYLDYYPQFTRSQAKKLARTVHAITQQRLSSKSADRLGSPNLPSDYINKGLIYPL